MSSKFKDNEEFSEYDATDSDEDYNENEKILLEKVRRGRLDDSEEDNEVLGVGSDDDDQSDIAVSDVEGREETDELPDARAWGKDKRRFYSTDYVDPDYGGFQGKDAHLAELEEEEARNLQQQLAEQLDDDDFILDVVMKKDDADEKKVTEELVKSDISKLSKRQKLQILQKESPEFFGLVEDFQDKMTVVKDYLSPIIGKYKKGQISNCAAIEFVTQQYELTLNYCVNIYMYLLLKASRVSIQSHPIIKRLYQYRQLLLQLSPIFDEIIKPQIELLIAEDDPAVNESNLNILTKLFSKQKKNAKEAVEDQEQPNKKVRFNEDTTVEQEATVKENEVIGKRSITYEMAKNKGLTPRRKKEQRNPRVKHRNKFKKAKIRRKGAVREPRTEMSRYGGEISGIKASVSKSIKIKS